MGELFAYPRLGNAPMDRVPLTGSEAERFLLKEGDLLFARQSLVLEGAGKCSLFLKDDEPVTFESHVTRVRLDASKAHSHFYFYYLRSPLGQAAIRSIVEQGAGASGIRGSDLGTLDVQWRPVDEQQAIADVLGALDDKIELNRRMNETLEGMARALFKSWFIDFDPVRAKAEGHDADLPKHHVDLFPQRFVESELGEIPEGWEVDSLSNHLAELEVGGRPKGGVSAYADGIPSIGAESVVGLGVFDYSKTKYIPKEFFEGMTRGHIKSRDVLLYKDGGRPGVFEPHLTIVGDGFPFAVCAINEHVYRLRCQKGAGPEFPLFLALVGSFNGGNASEGDRCCSSWPELYTGEIPEYPGSSASDYSCIRSDGGAARHQGSGEL
jgi:type I restriction enzyme S subunit